MTDHDPARPASGTAGTSGTAAPSDAELLASHVDGDPEAFGELVRRHRDRLWAVALRTLGDREEAADAVQDALVSAYRSARTFQGRSAVTTWLHRITVNACIDRARKAASRRTSLTDDTEKLDQLLEPHESAAVPAERADLQRQLVAALDELPTDQRAALVLVDMQGYPVAEAARMLDIPPGTVKSRCARGRARLLPLVRHLRPDGSAEGGSAEDGSTEARGTARGNARGREKDTQRNRTPGASVPPAGQGKGAGAVKDGGAPS